MDNFDDEPYKSLFDNPYAKGVFIFLYAVVFLLAFIGNILVITVVLKHRRMRTITNFFLANLAVADLAVGIFCVLPNLSLNLSPTWILGKAMCKLYFFVQTMSYTASIIILTVISIERYVAIIFPLRAKQLTTMCLLRVTVLLIWLISAASGIPYLIVYDLVEIPRAAASPVHFCIPRHPKFFNMKAFLPINFVLWYCMPLILMTVMYTKISIVLWKTSSQAVQAQKAASHKPSSSASSGDYSTAKKLAIGCRAKSRLVVHKERKHESALLARRRVIRLLIAVIVSFTLCVLPYHLRMLWMTYWEEIDLNFWQQLLQPLTFVIFYLNCGLNPLLYAFLSERFRASLIEIVTCKDYRRQRQNSFSLKTMNSTV
ncbi:hypothetical protein CAPTEDRAFT_89755 [Capitella teleta]|uniref:G-protein coupled receptors family 1 profile domain-containing protein n=1 Tax=Capitella teleta TaxID=283909 RepID=R7TAC8_CAPTE|nr:hypothetical protein CAPTEDRAFT_89755 [Capitella teleta]|eukprot:ELT88345.1 hypothetical protein CAPTEDRAFT_89755 [Capitella teleta]